MKHFPILLVVIGVCVFGWSSVSIAQATNEEQKFEERITALEKVVTPPNPLAHDIGLRRELEQSITEQKNINKQIDKIDESIKSLEKNIREFKPSISPEEFNKKLTDIRTEYLAQIDLIKKHNTANLNAFIASSDKALASAATSAESTNGTLDSFVSLVQIILGFMALLGLLITVLLANTNKTVKNVQKVSDKIKNTIGDELNQLQLLKKEMKLVHKFIDLKDSYRLYRTQHKSREVEQLKSHLHQKIKDLRVGYQELENIWKSEEESVDRKEFLDEVYDNLSYCYAVSGVIEYNEGNQLKAADWFELAYHNNVNSFTDRIYNFGCASAFRYAINHEQSDLNKLVDCYVELAKSTGERERFINDDDIVRLKLKDEIDSELMKRGQNILIVQAPKPKKPKKKNK